MSDALTPERRAELLANADYEDKIPKHFGHEQKIKQLSRDLLEAADEVAKLRAEVERLKADPDYPKVYDALGRCGEEECPCHVGASAKVAEQRIAALEADLAAARADDTQVSRLLAWIRDPKRKEPALAFTAGVLREAADEVMMLMRNLDEVRTLLIKHQWADSDARGRPQCPSCCGVAEGEGHYSDCEIAAAIRGTPKESAK